MKITRTDVIEWTDLQSHTNEMESYEWATKSIVPLETFWVSESSDTTRATATMVAVIFERDSK